MGFMDSFLGHVAANAYSEVKKDERENQKWNDNFHQTLNYEQVFSDYISSIGSNAIYISEVDESATSVKNQIERYKRKIQEYLNLGGQGKYIYDLDELDEYIEIIKYLKSVGCIDRQEEFLGLDLFFAQNTIEREKEEQEFHREMEIPEIVGSDINSLSGVEFEKVCQQLVESMGFETETTKASGDGGIDLIAYNHQPLLSGKYIIQCKRYSGSVGEPIIRDLYGVVMSERANKGILMTTGYFTKSAIAFADGKPIELIDGEKLKVLLGGNDLKNSTSKNNAEKWKIDSEKSDEENFYNYHLQVLYNHHSDELLYQLTFLEVAVTRIYTEVWCEGNLELQDIIDDFYNVYNSIDIDELDDNVRYSLMFLLTTILLFSKKYDELIDTYYALLEWDKLVNSVTKYNGLDGIYFAVVNNLIQILLLLDRVDEAEKIRKNHYQVIEYQIDYYEGQLGDYDEVHERFAKLKEITLSKDIGYFWLCELSSTSVSIEGREKISFDNHYSKIYYNFIDNDGEYFDEGFTFWNEIYLVQDDEAIYYLETSQGNRFFC